MKKQQYASKSNPKVLFPPNFRKQKYGFDGSHNITKIYQEKSGKADSEEFEKH